MTMQRAVEIVVERAVQLARSRNSQKVGLSKRVGLPGVPDKVIKAANQHPTLQHANIEVFSEFLPPGYGVPTR
jgi:hypothetical protein